MPHSLGELRREVDPAGKIVEHRVRKSSYVHERMHSAGKVAPALYGAAEKFRMALSGRSYQAATPAPISSEPAPGRAR